jgi:TonB family protein
MKKIFAIGIFMLIANLLSAQTTVADSVMKLKPSAFNRYIDSSIKSQPEVAAQFPGGMQGIANFLNEQVKYPKKCEKANIEGKASIEFIVCTDGSICNHKVIESSGNKLLDAEALRVVKLIPKVKPASKNGVPVPSYFNVPITFVLGD